MMEKTLRSPPKLASSSIAAAAAADAAPNGSFLSGGANTSTSSSSSSSKTSSNSVQSSLKSLNRASYKISKPLPRNPVAEPKADAPPPPPPEEAAPAVGVSGGGGPPYQPQPPVYNIDKNDFRDVVQKLTGSPACRPPRAETPPPPPPRPSAVAPHAATALTSRLHRIRPPPLAHLSLHPRPLVPAPPPPPPVADPWTRPPLSPLPPLPTVSAAAESPISAYMRRLRGGGGLPVLSPSPAATMLPPPNSPLGFGCMLSPRTAYQMMMAAPGLQLPTSPGVQLASPRLGDP